MQFDLILENWDLFARGVWTTLWLVGSSLFFGALIGVPLGVARAYRVPVLSQFSAAFSYVWRGTPLLVQLYLLYYGLSQFEAVRDSVFWVVLSDPAYCALLAFSLNSAAYVTELARGTILLIPKGQIEAARAIGMNGRKTIMRIVLPAAIRRALPAYSNEVIFLLHASVIASTITIVDILGAGRTLNGTYYIAYEGFLTAAVLYMIIVLLLDRLFKKLELRLFAHL
ncbi:ABC transporter permease subunit [Pseudohalocynthiibacter aestuariivivens]|nr:ABC transporter permease subunit [Pseudohalocynthiibacter aestuariivivens]QIE45992.1 ABC transporter permease subunit [Pseudohalocynthiibacter aestuariivivens]